MIRLGIERYGGAYFSHIRAERMSIRDLTSNFSTRGASLIYGWGGRGAPYIDEGSVHILGTLELVSLDGELLAGLGNGSLDTGLDELQGLGMRGRGGGHAFSGWRILEVLMILSMWEKEVK